jgi:DNA-binding NarL/FixJ family response regulator
MQLINPHLESLLLIDDDPDEYSILKDALEEIEPTLKLSYASTCSGILAELENCKPDLIFLDINLPAISGFECLKEIKESIAHCQIPVIIYSNSQFQKDVDLAYDLKADLYLNKSCSFQQLVDSLKLVFTLPFHSREIRTDTVPSNNSFILFPTN